MKKLKAICLFLILSMMCFPLMGCPAKEPEDAYLKKLELLTYDDFKLAWIATPSYKDKRGKEYRFMILSSEDLIYETIELVLHTDEDLEFIKPTITKEILNNGEILDIFIHCYRYLEVTFVPCTLYYTNVAGEEISKEYILDFTQEPFWGSSL